MAVNLWVARYERRKAHELGSALLRADARHTQSDLYASVAVVASFVAARAGLGWADGVATLLLVALIGHAAWEVFRENVPVLIDAAMLDPHSVAALAGPLARGGSVHRVRSRGVRGRRGAGPAPRGCAGHERRRRRTSSLAQITMELKVKFPEVSDVIIHIEPKTRSRNAR